MNRTQRLRLWMLILFIAANIGIAGHVSAAWNYATCEDPETGEAFLCCTWCAFFCECELDDAPMLP